MSHSVGAPNSFMRWYCEREFDLLDKRIIDHGGTIREADVRDWMFQAWEAALKTKESAQTSPNSESAPRQATPFIHPPWCECPKCDCSD